MRETKYQSIIRAQAARAGVWLYRNNVGACIDQTGRRIQFGLCPGSADLIGWTPVVVTPDMVGKTVAVFTSIELKSINGRVSDTQQAWCKAVLRDGGIARIMREPETW